MLSNISEMNFLIHMKINVSMTLNFKKIAKNAKVKSTLITDMRFSNLNSSLSKMNICYFLKLPMSILSIMHREVYKKVFQKPDYLKTSCDNLNNPFHFE